jgi:hypothetical protein
VTTIENCPSHLLAEQAFTDAQLSAELARVAIKYNRGRAVGIISSADENRCRELRAIQEQRAGTAWIDWR